MSSLATNGVSYCETPRFISRFSVSGMTCQNCALRATRAIESIPGVESADVDLSRGTATVRWSGARPPAPDVVIGALRRLGFSARLLASTAQAAKERSGSDSWRLGIIIGFAAAIPLAIGEWVLGFHGEPWYAWTAFILALVAQLFCGARFYKGAWAQLKALSANMDTLVALGSTTAFGFSTYQLVSGAATAGHLYYLESTSILALISLGHWLEARATERAAGAVRALLSLSPSKARRLSRDGSENEVRVDELRVGDLVVVRPGDSIPTDGVVVEGRATLDESMVTGEATPVEKGVGDTVYGGTMNSDGRLIVRVSATGRDTVLARIINAVQRAQHSRAQIQRIGDRVSSVFVPSVVLVAVATGLWWGLDHERASAIAGFLSGYLWPAVVPSTALAAAFINASAVLIVACPCAMGLATPAAIMAATNVAARRGFLIRDGIALEKAGVITTVVFDKTGTLTQGKLAVTAMKDFRNTPETTTRLDTVAAALSSSSNHPVSRAIAALAVHNLTPEKSDGGTPVRSVGEFDWVEWREIPGSGILARDNNNRTWRLGALPWLESEGVIVPENARFTPGTANQAMVGLASDSTLIGLFVLGDALRPEASEVVRALKASGKRVCMITGDRLGTATATAELLGISPADVFAEVQPEQKAMLIRDLQAKGERVAFVGDGINDAPALEQADLGIAVRRATDIAREAADIVLLRSDLQAVSEALTLARAALRTIKQNLFWAFFYNSIAVPLAALGFLSPIVCAATMGISDLIVIANALRLNYSGVTQRHRKALGKSTRLEHTPFALLRNPGS